MTPSSEPENLLVIMAKWPEPGAVKTRLAPELGDAGAAGLYRAFLQDVVEQGTRGPWRCAIAFSPVHREREFRELLPDIELWFAQTGDDLGTRMQGVFEAAFHSGAQRVLMRNSDSPTLGPKEISACFDSLARHPAVVAPDRDGGYWAIGLQAPAPALFNLQMSASTVMDETRKRAAEQQIELFEMPAGRDVDDAADLRVLCEEFETSEQARAMAPRSLEWLRKSGRLGDSGRLRS